MKTACERCGAVLGPHDRAFVCSHDCTFCAACSQALGGRCPNCGEVQVERARP